MTRSALTSSTAILTALVIATPAVADLTADDVYQSWIDTAEAAGQSFEVSEVSKAGGRMTLSGISSTIDQPDAKITVTMDDIAFVENGDGSVSIEFSDDYGMQVAIDAPDDEDVTIDMSMKHSGFATTATGDPDAISYAMSSDKVEFVIDSLVVEDEPIDMALALAFDAFTGTYDVTAGDPQTVDSTFNAAAAAFTMSVKEPEEEVDMTMNYTMEDIAATSTGTMSAFAAGGDFGAMLGAGMTSEGSFSYGPAQYEVDATAPDGRTIIEGSAESGSIDFALNSDGLAYGGTNRGVAMNVVAPGAMMPPIAFTASEMSGNLAMPLVPGEEAADFAIGIALRGLEVGEQLWSMVDPTGGIPRDPATLVLDIAGKGNWMVDLTDPEAMADMEMSGEMPGEVESVDVRELLLSLAGAELSGSGSFTFDNSVMPPMPSGEVNLQLIGANTLIDTLIGIGLLPEEQAMGARMMLGLFATPGDGEDTLVSTIELKDDGSVLANGQRIR